MQEVSTAKSRKDDTPLWQMLLVRAVCSALGVFAFSWRHPNWRVMLGISSGLVLGTLIVHFLDKRKS